MEKQTRVVRELQRDGKWVPLDEGWAERVVEVLIAQGKLWEFDVDDIPADQLRAQVENVRASQRIRYADFSETRERCGGAGRW